MTSELPEKPENGDHGPNLGQLLSRILHASPDVVYVFDVEVQQNIFINRTVQQALGYSSDQVEKLGGEFLTEVMHPEDYAKVEEHFRKLNGAEEGASFEVEYRMKDAGGRWRTFRSRDTVFRKKADGDLKEILGMAQDVTDRKAALDSLAESEFRFSTAFNYNPTPQAITTLQDGIFLDANQAFERQFGYHRDDILGRSSLEIGLWADPRDRQVLVEHLKESSLHEIASVKLRTKGGELRTVQLATMGIELNGVPCLINAAVDMTEAGEAKAQLEASEERYRALFTGSPQGILVADAESRKILVANPAICEITGYIESELQEMTIVELHPTALRDSMEEIYSIRPQVRGHDLRDTRFVTKDGGLIRADIQTSLISIDERPCVVSFITDVTKQLAAEESQARLQEKLNDLQRMEAMGTLAGGIAHDFNNILSAIIGYGELARSEAPGASQQRAYLDEVMVASQRARGLVEQILAFSKERPTNARPLDLGPIVAETLQLLRASLPATIGIEAKVSENLGTVLADPSHMHQVIMNLCTNAAQAMRDLGGVLSVTLTETDIGLLDSRHPGLQAGHYLCLTVADTGPGMEGRIMNRIFEPYFTTKQTGEGTGLGLAVVHGIVTGYDGTVAVTSEPGMGSCFTVMLPARHLAPRPRIEDSQDTEGTERILLVDDEAILVSLGESLLSRLGYRVTALTDPCEALKAFKERPQDFDLVITDQTMPGMTGDKLATEMLAVRPDLPIILCTGFSERIDEGGALELGIQRFLMKPLSPEQLATEIREVLDGVNTQ